MEYSPVRPHRIHLLWCEHRFLESVNHSIMWVEDIRNMRNDAQYCTNEPGKYDSPKAFAGGIMASPTDKDPEE